VLLENDGAEPVEAAWAAPILALGARLARRPPPAADRRLIVAITVPTRDLAAVLVATGWALTRPVELPGSPDIVLPTLKRGTPVLLLLAGTCLVAETFYDSRVVKGKTQIHGGEMNYQLEKIKYLVPAPRVGRYRRLKVPLPGSLVASAGRAEAWPAEQVATGSDVVLIGTKAWITSEMGVRIGLGDSDPGWNSFAELLRPSDGVRPSWRSEILPAARSEEAIVPPEARLTVLDGSSAIGWISDLSCDVTVAIVDRSAAYEFAADSIIAARSMGGIPVSLNDIGWHPPLGIEALAFETWR
jgi:hypothetical protein